MASDTLTYGGYYFSSSAATTLAAAAPAKAAGTTTALPLAGFTHTASNRVTYDKTTTRVFMVQANVCFNTVSGAETAYLYIYKNDALIPGTDITRKVSNNDAGAASCGALVSLDSGDYVELWVATLGGDNIVIDGGSLTIRVAG